MYIYDSWLIHGILQSQLSLPDPDGSHYYCYSVNVDDIRQSSFIETLNGIYVTWFDLLTQCEFVPYCILSPLYRKYESLEKIRVN